MSVIYCEVDTLPEYCHNFSYTQVPNRKSQHPNFQELTRGIPFRLSFVPVLSVLSTSVERPPTQEAKGAYMAGNL